MIDIKNFKYEDDDIISDAIITSYLNNEASEEFIEKYINDLKFQRYIKKNCLIKKINKDYLNRLYNDYHSEDDEDVVEEYNYITSVNPTRWI